jgi:hypothetical protein
MEYKGLNCTNGGILKRIKWTEYNVINFVLHWWLFGHLWQHKSSNLSTKNTNQTKSRHVKPP